MSIGYDEDVMLDVRDMQDEIREARESVPEKRTFPDVLNEWTEAVLVENRKADLPALAALLRLGALGQRLIYEANAIGMSDTVKALQERSQS